MPVATLPAPPYKEFVRRGGRFGAVQLNDVYVDDRQIAYAVDRHIGGLYVLELKL